MKKAFVILSLYNEEKHLLKTLRDLSKTKINVICVDDGSTDKSASIIKTFLKKYKNFVLLQHPVNLGKGSAMKTGAEYAFQHKNADFIIFMDSDGQHSVDDIPKFMNKLESGNYDIVFGSRKFDNGAPFVRHFGNKIASLLARLLFGIRLSDAICGFRALTKTAYKKIKWESAGYGVEIEMVARVGKWKMRYLEIPVKTVYIDAVKGVTLLDAFGILFQVIKWKLNL